MRLADGRTASARDGNCECEQHTVLCGRRAATEVTRGNDRILVCDGCEMTRDSNRVAITEVE